MKRFPYVLMAGLAIFALTHSEVLASEFDADVAEALSEDGKNSREAIHRLRSGGPAVFENLLTVRDQILQTPSSQSSLDLKRLNHVIDQVGGARYGSVSGLYWHTDLEQAIAEAKAAKKPILSLRMMGRLTDEYSCANSRFFRTTLYANREISKFLKENYVLHWKSVRPVPKVTIDFGDGRKLERTLTGNSIHYVLTSDGRVIDGLPGLYSPAKFLAWVKALQPTRERDRIFGGTTGLGVGLNVWHARQAAAIARKWKGDLDAVALIENELAAKPRAGQKNPPAAAAALRAVPKSVIEMPIIANIVKDTRELELRTENRTWEQIANRHLEDVRLDRASIELIRAENPVVASSGTDQDPADEEAFRRLIAAFEKAIALDTVRNEYLLHRKLHEWFAKGSAPKDLEQLNEKIYAELFLTPRQDPWIGLVPPDAYTGLNNGGVVAPK